MPGLTLEEKERAAALAIPRYLGGAAAEQGIAGLRLGIYQPYFADADPEVAAACSRAVDKLSDIGAQVRLHCLQALVRRRLSVPIRASICEAAVDRLE